MSARIIDTNEFLKNEKDFLMDIAKSTVVSFKLEGIIISLEDALKMAKKALNKLPD